MNNNIQYSIVYAVINPEIHEQLSVGLILMDGNKVIYRFSENKLQAVKKLFTSKEYQAIDVFVRNLEQDKAITTAQGIDYLSRYSNNLVSLSALKDINLPLTEDSSLWMFSQFVDRVSV